MSFNSQKPSVLVFSIEIHQILSIVIMQGEKMLYMHYENDSENCSVMSLCNPMDYTVHGILQIRILEWVAFPFSRGSSKHRDRTEVSGIVGGFFSN